jgi:tRNA uridine 5-carboxymethylaminomethyl modification enzyme
VLQRTLVRTEKGDRVSAAHALRTPSVRLETLRQNGDVALATDESSTELDVASLETTVKYAGYLKQETARAERLRREGRRRIPADFPFVRVPGLSREVVQRLTQVHPETLGQASRIPGITPAAVAVLASYLGRLTSDADSGRP